MDDLGGKTHHFRNPPIFACSSMGIFWWKLLRRSHLHGTVRKSMRRRWCIESLACSSSIMVPSKQNPSPRKVFGKRFLPDRWNMDISSYWVWSVFFLWFFLLCFHLLIPCLSPATRIGAKLSGFNKWLSFKTGGEVAVGYISLTRAEEFEVLFRWDESQLPFFHFLSWFDLYNLLSILR